MENIIIRTDSGVVFEVKHTPRSDEPERWTVIASIGRRSTTAEAIVGMEFLVWDNPFWFARGYAQIVQRGLNQHFELQEAR